MTTAIIEGSTIDSLKDVVESLRSQLYPGRDYGQNLSSLFDILSRDISRPVRITWNDSYESFKTLGAEDFGKVCGVIGRVATEEPNNDDFVFRLQ